MSEAAAKCADICVWEIRLHVLLHYMQLGFMDMLLENK